MKLFPILSAIFISAITFANTKFPPLKWDQKMVNQITIMARERSLPNATLPDGSLVGKETPDQKKKPLISEKFAKEVVDHSVFWNTAKWCGLSQDQADFSAFQDEKRWNGKQLAFIATLHGTTTSLVTEQLNSVGSCSKEFKTHLEKTYPKLFPRKP